MKTTTFHLPCIKDTNWGSVAYELKFDEFKKLHPSIDDDTLSDMFLQK